MLGNTRSGRFPKTESARARVNTAQGVVVFFFCARFWTGRFLMGKTINDRFANKELRPSGICLGATWAGIFPKRFLSWGLKTLFVSAGGG